MFKVFIKGDIIRHPRRTTHSTILNATIDDVKAHLANQGYFPLEIDPIIKETLNTNRAKPILKKTQKQSLSNPTVLIILIKIQALR